MTQESARTVVREAVEACLKAGLSEREVLAIITAHNDDGLPFLGDLVKNLDGSAFRSKTVHEQRREQMR